MSDDDSTMSGTGRSGPSKKRPLEDESLTGSEGDSRRVRYQADEDEEMVVEEEDDSTRVLRNTVARLHGARPDVVKRTLRTLRQLSRGAGAWLRLPRPPQRLDRCGVFVTL